METTTQLTDFLTIQSIQIAAIFAIVLILHWLLRNRSAHIRYLLWLLVAVKCVTPPLVIFSVPVLPTQPQVAAAPQPVPAPAPQPENTQYTISNTQLPPSTINNRPSTLDNTQYPISNTQFSRSSMTRTHIILAVYAAGGAFYFLWAIAKSVLLHRRLSALRRPLPEPMAAQIADLANLWFSRRVGSAHAVRPSPFTVWLAESISQPFVWGLLRGAIYLPARLQSIETDRQKAVVMHEMAHVVRFDALVNLLQILIQGIFWFHPLVWLANRFIRAEREKCCDEAAVARLGAVPKEYGSAIVDTLLQEYRAALPIPTLAVAGPVKNIEDRIKTIMQPNKRFYTRPTAIATLAILTLAALIVPTTIALTQKQEVVKESNITMLSLKVKVVDENGKPIANAEIQPDGLRTTEKDSGHYFWNPETHGEPKIVFTDNDGLADISYPKYTVEKLKTGEVSFSVRHPEYCPNRIFEQSLKQPNTVVLKKGAIVRVSGYIGSNNKVVVDKIYPQASSGQYRILPYRWKEIKPGVYECKEIESGTNYLRLVHFTIDGKIYFSETLQYQAQQDQISEYNLELKPGVRVVGQLDKSVPRPIAGGKVVAMVAPATLDKGVGRIAWQTWSTIDNDGTFVFESLPPDQLQLTGLCDGFVAANPDEEARMVKPQLFTLDKETAQIELLMKPAAICEVKVVDNENQPIKGAKVMSGQNIKWQGGGTQLFPGFSSKSEDTIAMDEKEVGNLAVQLWKSHFQAITNKDGIAVVRNLPGLKDRIWVLHDDYKMISDKKSRNPEEQEVLVDLVSGQTSTVTVKMQKKWKWLFWEKSKEVEDQKPEAASAISAKAFYEKAEELFHSYTTADPNIKKAKMNEALELYQQAYEANPSDPNLAASALMMMGLCYDHMGDDLAEITTYEKATALFPDQSPAAYFYLGDAYQDNGQTQEAIEALKKCLTLCTDHGQDSFPYSHARSALIKLGLTPSEVDETARHSERSEESEKLPAMPGMPGMPGMQGMPSSGEKTEQLEEAIVQKEKILKQLETNLTEYIEETKSKGQPIDENSVKEMQQTINGLKALIQQERRKLKEKVALDKPIISIVLRAISLPNDDVQLRSFFEKAGVIMPQFAMSVSAEDANKPASNKLTYGQSAFLSQQDVEKIVKAVQSNPDTKLLISPRVALYSGESATIEIASPLTASQDGGVLMQITPSLTAAGILSEFQISSKLDNQAKQTVHIQSKVVIPQDKTLLILGPDDYNNASAASTSNSRLLILLETRESQSSPPSQGGVPQSGEGVLTSPPQASADPNSKFSILNSPFTASLPNGVTVELVGLGTAPWKTEQQWWKPDGTNLNQPTLTFPHLFEWKDQPNGSQFACTALCKFSNYAGKELTIPEVKFSNEEMLMRVWGTDFTMDGYEMTYIASNPYFETVPEKTDMRLAVASKEFSQAKRIGSYTPKQHQTYSLERNRDWVILHPIRIGQTETPCVDLTCKQENKDIEFRVFAKLKNGQTERWYGGGVGKEVLFFQSTQKPQNTKIEDIEDIIIEFRPYEWITFKNVSLKPGKKTDVKIELSEKQRF